MSIETPASPLTLTPTSCGLCGSDEAEPLAVGEDFERRSSPDTYLAVRCSRCGLVYLRQAPTPSEFSRIHAPRRDSWLLDRVRRGNVRRQAARWGRMLPHDPLVLVIGPGAVAVADTLRMGPGRSWRLEAIEPDWACRSSQGPPVRTHVGRLQDLELSASSYDGALLIGSLERVDDPVGTLREVGRLLRPGGRVLVLMANPGSAAAAVFRGRHWSGYDFPRHRALADPATLGRLVARAGLAVESITSASDPGGWVLSITNLLRDWGAPRFVTACLGPSSLPAIGLAGLLEGVQRWRGKAGLVQATLRLPGPSGDAS